MKTKPSLADTTCPKRMAGQVRTACATRLLMLLLLLALPAAVQAEDYTYTNNGGTITITKYTGPGGAVNIPGTINGLSVTSIGDYAFSWCTSLASVTIPDSVISIGSEAFKGCTSLTNIMIGNHVTSIPSQAFSDCISLASITIPDSVTTIGDLAFYYCTSLTSVTIGNSVTSLGIFAFAACFNLTNVTIGNSVTSIGGWAFFSCFRLTNVTTGNGVTSIGQCAFQDCTNLTTIMIPDSVSSIGESAFEGCTSLANFTIPRSVSSIAGKMFWRCTSLTNVTIPNSVTKIEGSVFQGCSSLTSITVETKNPVYSSLDGVLFNKSQTTLIKCPQDKRASYTIPTSVTSVGDSAFYECTSLTSVTIGNSLTSIGGWAFFSCFRLTNVTIGNGVTSIGNGAFYYCSSLTNVTIPNSVTNIGDRAFQSCRSLTSVTIPSSVRSIGPGAFIECSSLTDIMIPNSVTSIGAAAFNGCPSLRAITVDTDNPVYSSLDGVLFNKSQTTLIKCPQDKRGSYSIPTSVTSIGQGAFSGCQSLTDIMIPNSVTSIGGDAFSWSTSLRAITVETNNPVYSSLDEVLFNKSQTTLIKYPQDKRGSYSIPTSVTSIGDDAFRSCSSLTSVTIGKSVTSIGVMAFAYCYSLTAVFFQGNAPTVGPYAFDGVYATVYCMPGTTGWGSTFAGRPTCLWDSLLQMGYTITNGTITITKYTGPGGAVIIPDTINGLSVTSIGDGVFRSCSSLTSLTIPHSVTSIAGYAFAYCYSLTAVFFQGNAPTVGPYAFDGVYATVYYMPGTTGWGSTFAGRPTCLWDSLLQMGYTITNGTITITKYTGPGGAVIIPDMINSLSVASIGDGAFSGCTSLTSVTIPNSVTSIGDNAFASCTSLTTITIPDSVTNIGGSVFRGCSSLTSITVETNNPVYSSLDGVLFNKSQTTLIKCPQDKRGSYTIPTSVTSIGLGAFEDCTSLTSVTIPDGVTSIEGGTFAGCTSLANITIPSSVTSIGDNAFASCASLTTITIPSSVINIEGSVFRGCSSLTSITVETNNPVYSSLDGVLFNKSQTTLMECPPGKVGSYTVPDSVTSIEGGAFSGCTSLTSVTIGTSVTNIGTMFFGPGAFWGCTSLTSVYFKGNAPSLGWGVFDSDNDATVYYLPGTTGWIPQVETTDASFGVQGNQFGFAITGTSGLGIVVEACTNFAQPIWSPVDTRTLYGGSSYFSDPDWMNYPARFYRLRGSTFGGRPTALWVLPNPLILNNGPSFGVQTNGFGFIISWATNISVVVEACTNLANPIWTPVGTNTLSNGWSYFSDPEWTNYPARFYRLQVP